MGLFDDDFLQGIGDKINTVSSNVAQSIGDFVEAKAGEALVKVGGEPGGNLTAQQIANGQTGSGAQLRPSSQPIEWLQRAAASVGIPASMAIPAFIGGGVLVYFLLKRRR